MQAQAERPGSGPHFLWGTDRREGGRARSRAAGSWHPGAVRRGQLRHGAESTVLRNPPSLLARSSYLPSRHCRRLRPDGSDSGTGSSSSSRNVGSGGLRGGLCSGPNPADDPKCLLLPSVESLLRRRRGLRRFLLHFRLGLASSDVTGPMGCWEVGSF